MVKLCSVLVFFLFLTQNLLISKEYSFQYYDDWYLYKSNTSKDTNTNGVMVYATNSKISNHSLLAKIDHNGNFDTIISPSSFNLIDIDICNDFIEWNDGLVFSLIPKKTTTIQEGKTLAFSKNAKIKFLIDDLKLDNINTEFGKICTDNLGNLFVTAKSKSIFDTINKISNIEYLIYKIHKDFTYETFKITDILNGNDLDNSILSILTDGNNNLWVTLEQSEFKDGLIKIDTNNKVTTYKIPDNLGTTYSLPYILNFIGNKLYILNKKIYAPKFNTVCIFDSETNKWEINNEFFAKDTNHQVNSVNSVVLKKIQRYEDIDFALSSVGIFFKPKNGRYKYINPSKLDIEWKNDPLILNSLVSDVREIKRDNDTIYFYTYLGIIKFHKNYFINFTDISEEFQNKELENIDINLKLLNDLNNFKFIIYDYTGKVVDEKILGNTFHFDNLKSGIYFLLLDNKRLFKFYKEEK